MTYGYGMTGSVKLGSGTHVFTSGDWVNGRWRKTSVTRLEDGTEITKIQENDGMIWKLFNGCREMDLGFLPMFMREEDPRPAREQIHDNYRHGGGWRSFTGFDYNPRTLEIVYPGDPPMLPLATTKLRDETIIFYPHAWLLVLQPDGTFEVSRVD